MPALMQKLFPDAAAALEGVLRNDMLIASGGFGLCGIPELLIDAIEALQPAAEAPSAAAASAAPVPVTSAAAPTASIDVPR